MALRLVKTGSVLRVSIGHLLKTPPVFQVSACKASSQYKSSISIDQLYPDSENIKISHPEQLESGFNGFIPMKDLMISYSSNNVGGDTSTKVDIRYSKIFKYEKCTGSITDTFQVSCRVCFLAFSTSEIKDT